MEKKKLIGIFIIVPLLIALIFVGLGRKCRRSGDNQKLIDIRAGSQLDTPIYNEGVDAENGLITKKYLVPRSILTPPSVSDFDGDPFAVPDSPKLRVRGSSSTTPLERAGIVFGTGASAIYEIKTNTLIVRNTEDQLELVEAYIETLYGALEKQIAIRAEIFEMPSLMALEVIESAADEGAHSPERKALRKILGKNKVRLVNAITIIARSGQRAKIEDAQDFPLPLSRTASINKEDENGNRPDWEIKQIGTIFEVDPVLGGDEFTIDLNFSLEHHTALPDPKPGKGKGIPPTLHAKKITTQITTQDGASILVGSWKPTGKPEYEKSDLMHLIFITANVQTPTAPVEVIEKVAAKK